MMQSIPSIKRISPFILSVVIVSLVVFAISRIVARADGIDVKTFRIAGGWGYQVEVNGKVYIYQPFIPGVPDKKPFPTAETARRTGRLVEEKLKDGINPVVSGEELKEILKE